MNLKDEQTMQSLEQAAPQQPDVFQQATNVLEALKKVDKIETDAQEKVAATYIGVAKKVVKAVDDARLEQTRPLDDRKKAIMAEFKSVTEPVDLELKRVEGIYLARQKKKQREAEVAAAKLKREQEEAARKEAERVAAEANAEADRLAALGQTEQAAAVVEQANVQAQEVIAQAAAAPAPTIPVETKTRTAVGTIHLRDNWKAEVLPGQAVPEMIICKHCGGETPTMGKGQLPAEYWTPDEKKLNQAAKDGARQIDGARIWNDQTVSGR